MLLVDLDTFMNMQVSAKIFVILCVDEKHRVKVGEPEIPVAAVEQGR